ncbi:MAG: SGNH/GDSL hydrolase family protein [Bacteroidales bacterium]|nr:SGNH/GDSL hydrolase family protein [Bacteroidales bacterium]
MKKTIFLMLSIAALFSSCDGSGSSKDENVVVAGQEKELKTKEVLKVACIGNSITKHGYLPSVGWYGDWGMAASKEENDYCHVLQAKLKKYNASSSVTAVPIQDFELNPSRSLDYLDSQITGAGIIVIRIGENVQDASVFGGNFLRLVDKCKNVTAKVLIVGSFWENDAVETVLRNVANTSGCKYVSLSSVRSRTDVYPQKGDMLYDRDGNAYKIETDFILTHPNDKGMSLIATAIFNGIASLDD